MHCVRANIPSEQGGGQECCYNTNGMIINFLHSPGGGYIHRYHHGGVIPYGEPQKVPYLSHYLADTLPWTYCCRYGHPGDRTQCHFFAMNRPSQVCDNYIPPPPALGNGDPHIATLDSTMYTFNGYGEFTMLNALNGTFLLQTRTAPLAGVADATVFVAMAARYADSDVIHIQTNERRILDAYVRLGGDGQNFTKIDFDQASRWSYSGISVTGRNISSDGILVAFDGGVGLKMKASEGAMSILLVAPDSFRGQTQGLMGTWNGNASDDFLTPQGSILSPTLTTEQLHYQFGLQWEVNSAESLLFYEPGTDHETHTDRGYLPVFEPVINPSLNQTLVEEVCGTNQFCIFDYQTTGSQSFAQVSVQAFEEYEEAVDSRASFVICPTLSAPANGSAIVSTYMPGGVATFVCDNGFELSHVVNLTCQSNGTWSDGNIPACFEVFVQTVIMTSVFNDSSPFPEATERVTSQEPSSTSSPDATSNPSSSSTEFQTTSLDVGTTETTLPTASTAAGLTSYKPSSSNPATASPFTDAPTLTTEVQSSFTTTRHPLGTTGVTDPYVTGASTSFSLSHLPSTMNTLPSSTGPIGTESYTATEISESPNSPGSTPGPKTTSSTTQAREQTQPTEVHVTEDLKQSPQMTTLKEYEPEALPTWSIVLISIGSVAMIGAIAGLIISHLCKPKKRPPSSSNSVAPVPSQAWEHENPTFIQVESME